MTTPPGTWCNLCPGPVPTRGLFEHLDAHHPGWDPPDTWPDGAVVVTEPLEPREFEPQDRR